MRVKELRIQNFRRLADITIPLAGYTCFVGQNGAGKSTVLAALNVFFKEQSDSTTDVSKLSLEDFSCQNTGQPIKITVTFDSLGQVAAQELSNYVRQGELVVTAEATFDDSTGVAIVRHYGERLGMASFRGFFESEKGGASAAELNGLYQELQVSFPDLPNARSKADKIAALQTYEAEHTELCQLIPSEDNFYGINGAGKLAPFIQWVYVPAVKDASDESQEGKASALGKLLARTVRSRINFDEEIESLRSDALGRYRELLDRNQDSLNEISGSLQRRLGEWAHPDIRLALEWLSDLNKSVVVQPPVAGIKTGDANFFGSINRMGHGLQRSYLLALLQELAASDGENAPTLLLGVEEPELYQHPPQARHLADVLEALSIENNQILITTHSPIFVKGQGFENVRLVTASGNTADIKFCTFDALCARIQSATGQAISSRTSGLIAKIHQSLQPGISEMFFAKLPVLVEGLEDVSYITTYLHLSGRWPEFRRLGCHLVPVHGKDKLIRPIAMAASLNIPFFVVFDADGNTNREDHRKRQQLDNRAIASLLGLNTDDFPSAIVVENNCVIWPENMGNAIRSDFQEDQYNKYVGQARQVYNHEGGLEKHDLFIAEWLTAAFDDGCRSSNLEMLCDSILEYARSI